MAFIVAPSCHCRKLWRMIFLYNAFVGDEKSTTLLQQDKENLILVYVIQLRKNFKRKTYIREEILLCKRNYKIVLPH